MSEEEVDLMWRMPTTLERRIYSISAKGMNCLLNRLSLACVRDSSSASSLSHRVERLPSACILRIIWRHCESQWRRKRICFYWVGPLRNSTLIYDQSKVWILNYAFRFWKKKKFFWVIRCYISSNFFFQR